MLLRKKMRPKDGCNPSQAIVPCPRNCAPTSKALACTRAANDRQGIEQPCRYITISNERLSINRDGNAVLKLKTPWRNGTTHIALTPMEFMQRLAALVPRPRLHLIRFHGVLAPNAKLRSQVVPVPARKATTSEGDCNHAHRHPLRRDTRRGRPPLAAECRTALTHARGAGAHLSAGVIE